MIKMLLGPLTTARSALAAKRCFAPSGGETMPCGSTNSADTLDAASAAFPGLGWSWKIPLAWLEGTALGWFYWVVNGRREQLAGSNLKVTPKQWHRLGLRAGGERFTVSYDGKTLFGVTDKTIAEAGGV